MHQDNTVHGASPGRRRRDRNIVLKRTGLMSVPLSLFAVLVVTSLDPPASFQSPSLLFILNTVFISCVCLLIAFVAARSFLRIGRASLLLVGCGALMFAIGSFESGLVSGWPDGASDSEGLFGSAIFIGSLFHIAGAGRVAGQAHLERPRPLRVVQVVVPYLAVLVLGLALVVAIRSDLLPTLFVQGTGPTLLRQAMLGVSVVFFGGSVFLFYDSYLHSHSELAYWYALALALVTLGLFTDSLISAVWSAAYWLGYAAQYLGGIYLLIAILWVRDGRGGQTQWEEALTPFAARANEEYEALVETAMDAILVMDERGRVLLWNPAAERIFGYSRAEAVGTLLIDLVVEERFQAFLWQELSTFLETGQSALLGKTTEIWAKRKNGQVFAAEFTVSARETATGWVGTLIIRDISDRKKAEEEREDLLAQLGRERDRLRQSNLKIQTILSTITESYVRLDREWRIVEVNSSAERGMRRSRGELIGQPVTVVFEGPELLEFFRQFQDALREQKPIHLEAYSKSRNEWYEVHAYPFPDGVEIYYRDITRRKQIQEQVSELNRALERRAAELESVNRELESFSYSVSHDLRTPLASIHSFSQLVLRDYRAQLPENARRYLEQVQASAIAMSDLIEGLLALSRSTRVPLLRQEVVTVELVRQVLETLEKERAGRQIEIVVGALPNCRADPTLLKQVWINLLSNAIKFTRPRAVARIEINSTESSARPPLVTLQPPALKEQPTTRPCTYYVRDNGVGFDMASAERLFGVFQRLHGEDKFEGHGVGLATVERIVQRHGGRVWAEAEVDKGATFYFTLEEA
jgi:PAS domain S-box-containing protein